MSVLSFTGSVLQACTLWSLGTSPWYVLLLLSLPESLLRLWSAHASMLQNSDVVIFAAHDLAFEQELLKL